MGNKKKYSSITELRECLEKGIDIKVGDTFKATDIGGKAVFEIADVRKKYIYVIRKYVLNDEFNKDHYELDEFLDGEYYNSLPQELTDLIVERDGRKIFVPREKEIFGENIYSAEEKGKQWEIFKTTKGRIRTQDDKYGIARRYWESSPNVSYSSSFCYVTIAGAADGNVASTAYGVLPCFRIVASAT